MSATAARFIPAEEIDATFKSQYTGTTAAVTAAAARPKPPN